MRSLPVCLTVTLLATTCALGSGCGPFGRTACLGMRIAAPLALLAAEDRAEQEDREALEAAEYAPIFVPEIPHEPPRITPPEPSHVAFDSVAALAALHATDMSSCVARGAPRAYGHARVTLKNDGHASIVSIDSPSGMTGDAVACIGEQLGRVSVPPFDGAEITVGASYLVKE